MSTPENPKGTKNPITLKIKFKSGSIEQFIERYSVDVSRGGIFIRTKEPLAVGTPLRFEFQLQDGTALISGDGTVVWNRAFDPNRQNVAPGMGVRFDKLTPDSQRVLERILSDKEKRGDTQLESRFDAGVRASMANAPEPASSGETPKGNMFGDEPTRAMAADQVNKLAEAMQRGGMEEDQPTRAATAVPSDLSDEVRKLAGTGSEGSGSLPAIPTAGIAANQQKMEPMRAPAASPMMRSTLLGQGFGLTPAAKAPSNPGDSPAVAAPFTPSLEILRPDPSGVLAANKIEAAATPLESAVTPVKSAEVAARVADSQRTPAGGVSDQSLSRTSEPTPVPAQAPTPDKAPEKTPVPEPKEPTPGQGSPAHSKQDIPVPAAEPSKPEVAPVEQAKISAANAVPASGSSSSKGLFIGAAVLLLLVAVAGYFAFTNLKAPPAENKPQPPTEPVQPPPPPPQPPVLIPEKGAGDAKAGASGTEAKSDNAAKPAEGAPAGDGAELASEPPGAQVELGGKALGVTPVKLPTSSAGKVVDVKLTLRGYQELHQKIKVSEDNKPISLKLVAIERQMEILSTPKGADVFIDGKKVGRTPWIIRKVDLSKTITVEIRRAGFEPWTHNVADTEAFVLRNKKEVLTLNATLEPTSGRKGSRPAKKTEEEAPAAPQKAQPEPPKAPEPAKSDEAPKAAEPDKPAPEPAKPAADAPKPAEGGDTAKAPANP